MSLRTRLLLATAVTMLCALAIVDVATYAVVSRGQLKQVDAALDAAHEPIEAIATMDAARARRTIDEVAPGLSVAIVDSTGTTTLQTEGRSPDHSTGVIDVSTVDLSKRRESVRSVSGYPIRVRLDRLADGSTLIVGQSLHEVDETRATLITVLTIATLAAIALATALGWWLVRAGLAPLRRVEASAARISDSALDHERVPGDQDATEVGRLAAALNAMLDRLQESSDQREATVEELRRSEATMRQFVADASHELRTPIAATAAYAELFEQGARERPADLERAMTGIRSETGRMGELVDDLLLLAKLDENRPISTEPVDLTEIVLASIEVARTLDTERTFRPHITSVINVIGDSLRMRQVVDNLLANVRAHTPSAAACDVTLEERDSSVYLTVADNGNGVPETLLPHLFDRFSRADDARTRATGGNGLGLSIVEAIVVAHGGSISAAQNVPNGLVITVVLPATPSREGHEAAG